MFTTRCAAGTVSAAVDDDTTVGTYEVRQTRCLSTRVRRRKRLLLAEAALEQRAESSASTFGVGSPWSRLKRRLVTYVPLVPTSELGNPVAMLVLVVPDDLALHRVRVRRADGPAPAPRLTQGALRNTHMEWSLSTAQGLVARGQRGEFGGESASAVVDVCVATHMRGLGPHDRMCEMRSVAVLSRRAWPLRAAPSVLSGRSSRRCAGALSSPSR
jgi:hypothetical protein